MSGYHAGLPTFADAVALHRPKPEASKFYAGWYNFEHPGGAFEVCLRPGGVFYAPDFPCNSRWCAMGDNKVGIAWGKYGNYEMTVVGDPAARRLSGSAVPPAPGDAPGPNDWRRMAAVRPLSPAEARLLSPTGGGSEWKFEYEGGRFTRIDRDAVLEEIAESLAGPLSLQDTAMRQLAGDLMEPVRGFYKGWV